MKKSDLKKLVQEYALLKAKSNKKHDQRILAKLKEIERRYYHETGNELNSVDNG